MSRNRILVWTTAVIALGGCARPAMPAPFAAGKEIAITFDDLPAISSRHDLDTHREIADRLREAILRSGVPAIGFVNEERLRTDGELDPARVALLEAWLTAGLELGNHGYSHLSLDRVPLRTYKKDVVRGETVTRELLRRRGSRLRYFRHPFLQTGSDLETKLALEKFLRKRGYRVAPVTIDNTEWIFARAYALANDRGAGERMQSISAAYLDYMLARVGFVEEQTEELFGRPIRHVLLLHANRLNADHLDALVERLRETGYTFVTLDAALEDPAYRSDDRYTGERGVSWVHRWALTRGADDSFFDGGPPTPEFVIDEALLGAE